MVEVLARELQKEFPGAKGYSMQNLWRMRSFYLEYKDNSKLSLLAREISWTNNCTIITKCKDDGWISGVDICSSKLAYQY